MAKKVRAAKELGYTRKEMKMAKKYAPTNPKNQKKTTRKKM